jgi:hypothetical protein
LITFSHFLGSKFSFKKFFTLIKSSSNLQCANRVILLPPASSKKKGFHRPIGDSGSVYYLYPVSFSASLAKKRKTVKVFVLDGFLIETKNISMTYQLQAVR